jgi:hypothetical protein
MAARARYRTANDPYDVGDDYGLGGLLPERIGPRPPSRWRKALLKCVVLLVAVGGGWALFRDPTAVANVRSLLQTVAAAMSPSTDRKMPAQAQAERLPAVPGEEMTSPPASTEPTRAAAFTVSPASEQPSGKSPPLTTASIAPAATDHSEPLPPANPDPKDPYQVRAAAAGLHPGLSRVLLTRMSDADYRNAGIAIQKALAEASDDEVFVWPRQRKPELALFKVHFVPGAAGACRRYVVSVTKDGWLTTALPMEKCGSSLRQARRS